MTALEDPEDQDDNEDDDDEADDPDPGSERKDFQDAPPLSGAPAIPVGSAGQTSFASLYFA
jgi:hypothetical protein